MSTNFFVVQAQRDLLDAREHRAARRSSTTSKSLVDFERVQQTSGSRRDASRIAGAATAPRGTRPARGDGNVGGARHRRGTAGSKTGIPGVRKASDAHVGRSAAGSSSLPAPGYYAFGGGGGAGPAAGGGAPGGGAAARSHGRR